MLGSKVHEEIARWMLFGIAAFLPFATMVPIFIALLLLNWLLEGGFREKFAQLIKRKWLIALMGFYLLHVAGLLFTSNMKSGTFDLEVKLSLFVLPLILGSKAPKAQTRDQVLALFLASCLLVPTLLLIRAGYLWFNTGENAFFYQSYSVWMHPSYFASYLALAMLVAFELFRKGRYIIKGWQFAFMEAYLITILILLSSKMGLITLVLIMVFGLVYLILSRKKYLVGALGLGLGIVGMVTVYFYVPSVSNRITQMFSTMKASELDFTSTESSSVRLLIWSEARTLIVDHPLIGVGTGDAKDALMQSYQRRGMTGALEKSLNAHSTYYQAGIALGIPGMLWLIVFLGALLIRGWRKSFWLLSGFALLLAIHFLVESMLETQAGVMFFAFFASLLYPTDQELSPE